MGTLPRESLRSPGSETVEASAPNCLGARAARGVAGSFVPFGSSTSAGAAPLRGTVRAVVFVRGKKENPFEMNWAFGLSELCAAVTPLTETGEGGVGGCRAQAKQQQQRPFPCARYLRDAPGAGIPKHRESDLREQDRPKALFI